LVTFTNPYFDPKTPAFENENTVSLGGGWFIAWGLPPYILTAGQIIKELAAKGLAPEKNRDQSIFITGISVPDLPWR